jgi:hypothetical protein
VVKRNQRIRRFVALLGKWSTLIVARNVAMQSSRTACTTSIALEA